MRYTKGWYGNGMVRLNIQCVVEHWGWDFRRLMISVLYCTYVNIYKFTTQVETNNFQISAISGQEVFLNKEI